MLRKLPLIVILGSTGTGKTKLSLELAERFGGEIISADSMQVYANLDIVTAKATKAERASVPHHLLDVATVAEPYTVLHFRNAALPIIENLLANSKIPIVVGGTNYYIESLLWDVLIGTAIDTSHDEKSVPKSIHDYLSAAELDKMSSDLLHNHLKKFDAVSANRIHPNNKRKIRRAIEVYQGEGETLTTKLQAQRQQPGANRLGGPLRFAHTIIFWLRCDQEVLNNRLNSRVDSMLEQGLLRELRAFHNKHGTTENKLADNLYTKGVLQTIGYKEFIPYLEKYNSNNDSMIEEYLRINDYKMPTENQLKSNLHGTKMELVGSETEPKGLDLLNSCLNELKLVTRRYSKKQIKWINNRFLASKERQVPDIYELDTTNVAAWPENVYQRAKTIIECYRNKLVCEIQPMAKRLHPGDGFDEETNNFCSTCERHFIGEFQWNLHLKSNKHKKRKEALNKKKKLIKQE